MEKYMLLIDAGDDTIGVLYANEAPEIGDVVAVELHDENGNRIEATGTVLEIL